MPADSEVSLPHSWRPLGVRMAAVLFGGALLVICVFTWVAFGAEVRARFTLFQRATLVGFGLMVVAVLHALTRSRVTAEQDQLVVVNGYKTRRLDWPEVLAVHLPAGAPWATLDLADGTTIPAMGIQGSDGERARRAVRELRSLIDR